MPTNTHANEMTRILRMVLAVTEELISCPDVDSMLRQAVEFARDRIGLERCAIFLERDGLVRGTYGTDRHGNTVAEHDLVMDIDTGWHDYLERLTPEDAKWFVDEEPQVEWDGEQVIQLNTKGWVAHTRITLADGTRGILCNDAYISSTPFDEMKQEIAAVFCSMLGKVISHKQVEDQLRQALAKERELVLMKSHFINNISHEFRTPMTIIQSSVDLLSRYGCRMDDDQRARHLSKIQGQVSQMNLLLDNTLTVNRAENFGLTHQPQPLDVVNLCQTAIEAVALISQQLDRIRFSHSGIATTCMLDWNLTNQIVMNLLTNALKYSPAESCVGLDVVVDTHQITITVHDDGIGIPAADQPQVFQEFYRGSNVGSVAGTGLGLSIVKRAAEVQGGSVTCQTAVGSGSTFTVTLPREPVAPARRSSK